MYYITCDLHTKRMQLCVVDDVKREQEYPLPKESILLEKEIPCEKEKVRKFLEEVDRLPSGPQPKIFILESTINWYWLVDFVGELVDEVKMVNPGKAKAIASAKIKTDKIDNRNLAWLAKNGLIPEIYIPPRALRDLRELLRFRIFLVRMRTRLKNKIHSILLKMGIRNNYSDLFGKSGIEFLKELDLRDPYRKIVNECLVMIKRLDEQIKEVEIEIFKKPVKEDVMTRIIKTLPGLGNLFSLHARLEIIDIDRFPTADNFVSYCGLAPGTFQSQDTKRKRGLLPHGNRWLKWIYIEAAHNASNHFFYKRTFHRQVYKNGKAVAKITVARRLAISTYYMLKTGEVFRGKI